MTTFKEKNMLRDIIFKTSFPQSLTNICPDVKLQRFPLGIIPQHGTNKQSYGHTALNLKKCSAHANSPIMHSSRLLGKYPKTHKMFKC